MPLTPYARDGHPGQCVTSLTEGFQPIGEVVDRLKAKLFLAWLAGDDHLCCALHDDLTSAEHRQHLDEKWGRE